MYSLASLICATAPTLPVLVLGRVLQGFSAGGEVGTATAYLLESATEERRGVVSSWLEASMGISNIVGALAAFHDVLVVTREEFVAAIARKDDLDA